MFNTPKDVLLIAEAYEAVLEAEGSKPDYIDLDGDKNKKESMKKAAADAASKNKKKPVKPTPKKESLTFRELYASVIND